MSFPKSYVFTGNKGEQIKQIGNAVDCSMSRALAGAVINQLRPQQSAPKRTTKIA